MLSFLDVSRWGPPEDQDAPITQREWPPSGARTDVGPPSFRTQRDPDVAAPSMRPSGKISLTPGTLIGGQRFLLKRLIASGAFGTLFEAQDTLLDRAVAIKILHAHLNHSKEIIARFTREARALARVQHPNVVSVLEMGQHDGAYFIVQELLTGINLREHIIILQEVQDRPKLTPREALSILLPIASGLTAVHECGIVHRDVKPENIVLTRLASGEIVPTLVDFGIAKMYTKGEALTRGFPLGTAWYMSPEQARDASTADQRADVWALAAVLYEVLSGSLLYDGPDAQDVLRRICDGPPRDIAQEIPELHPELAAILQRALDPDLTRRTPSMQALRDQIVAWLDKQAVALWFTAIPHGSAAPASMRKGGASQAPPAQAEEEKARGPEPVTHNEKEPEGGVFVPGVAAAAAKTALARNALHDAIELAERAIVADGAREGGRFGRMRLIQGIAHRWLGNYAECERHVTEALTFFKEGTNRWFDALGYLIIAKGYQGKNDYLEQIAREFSSLDEKQISPAGYIDVGCRLVVFLSRAGRTAPAVAILDAAARVATEREVLEHLSLAWLDVAHAELSFRKGDLAMYQHYLWSAVEGFGRGGDIRNEYLQRANVGNAFLHLGAYDKAIETFEKVIEIAHPMQLDFVTTVKVNLALALARAGRLDEAVTVGEEALVLCDQGGNARAKCVARLYLGIIRLERQDVDGASAILEEAIAQSGDLPDFCAYALAVAAEALLQRDQPEAALDCARDAKVLLDRLGTLEEGESAIRASYARALHATGDVTGARREIEAATRRLTLRARLISHPQQREDFLRRVHDNVRILDLATEGSSDAP